MIIKIKIIIIINIIIKVIIKIIIRIIVMNSSYIKYLII